MKKSNDTNLTELPHIGVDELRALAAAAKCDVSYARKVLKGDRDRKSALAKKIMRGAIALNQKIDKAVTTVTNKLSIETD